MATPKLALIPTGYKAGKLYSVLPESGVGDFTVVRATEATRVNEEGLIETMGANVPRLDYSGGGCPVLLTEPQSTNLVTYSEDFSDSSWTKLGSGTASVAIVTSNYATSPNGLQNASRLQCDLNGGTSITDQSLIYDTITGSGDTSAFVYVKSNTGSNQTFYLANTLSERVSVVATTEWQKFELNWNASANGRSLSIGTRGTTASSDTLDLLIWGAQVEALSYPTSYIPTSGSQTTRSAETCNNAGDAATFNDSEGVLMAEISALANDVENKFISISNGSNTETLRIAYISGTDIRLETAMTSGTNFQKDVEINLSDNNKVCFQYKSNEYKVFVNGFSYSVTQRTTTPSGLNELAFDRGDGAKNFYGNTSQIQYFNTVLTDSELEKLTSWTSFIEMAQSQLYSVY